ncbi:MAG: response regulator transcription factor [Microbacteriaceae bacterium]|nr:response regulator transcription factor [Microbacteriaceae bacterium]
MIRVLIVDDHPVVRAGLRALLASEPGFEVVADFATGEEAIQRCQSEHIDLVLMDLQLGEGIQGVDATRVLRDLAAAPHVLILTNYDTDADILNAVEAGASGYLLKDAPPAELIAAAQAAASGASALSPAVADRLVTRQNSVGGALSAREIEVLLLVAGGKSNREIGRELFLSEATVKSHLSHIFTKLGVSSRTGAVAEARASGTIR